MSSTDTSGAAILLPLQSLIFHTEHPIESSRGKDIISLDYPWRHGKLEQLSIYTENKEKTIPRTRTQEPTHLLPFLKHNIQEVSGSVQTLEELGRDAGGRACLDSNQCHHTVIFNLPPAAFPKHHWQHLKIVYWHHQLSNKHQGLIKRERLSKNSFSLRHTTG